MNLGFKLTLQKYPISKLIGLSTVGIAKILNNAIYIILTLLVVRLTDITTEEIGFLTYVLVVLTMATLVSDFGMTEAVQKFITHLDPKKVIGPVIVWKLIGTLFILCLIFITNHFTGFLHFKSLFDYLLFSLAVISSVYNVVILVFNSINQEIKSSYYQLIYTFLLLVVLLACLKVLNLDALTSSLIAIIVSWFGVTILIVRDLYLQGLVKFSLNLPKGFKSFSFSNLIFILAVVVYTQTDSIFIVNILGGSQGEFINGIYKPVAMIGFFPKVFSLLLTTPLLPIWSKLFDKQKFNTLKKTFGYGLGILSILGFITVLIGYFAGGFILNLLYANHDIAQQGSRVLFIILAGFVLHSVNYFSAYFLEAINKEKIVRNTSLIQMFFYILGMLFFTKTSLLAPAIVFILTELISVVVYVKKILEFKKS